MFSLPSDAVSGVINYAGAFFNDIKLYVFLALGVSLGLIIVGYAFTIIPELTYKSSVKREAKRRLEKIEEEEEEELFEEDVEEEMENIIMSE